MVEKNSPRYIDVLPKIVDSYNRTWHSGIRSEPITGRERLIRTWEIRSST